MEQTLKERNAKPEKEQGMLQQSRSSKGVKEPSDINAFADKYLQLSYYGRLNDALGQGLRAKDKTFKATMKSDSYRG